MVTKGGTIDCPPNPFICGVISELTWGFAATTFSQTGSSMWLLPLPRAGNKRDRQGARPLKSPEFAGRLLGRGDRTRNYHFTQTALLQSCGWVCTLAIATPNLVNRTVSKPNSPITHKYVGCVLSYFFPPQNLTDTNPYLKPTLAKGRTLINKCVKTIL